MALSPPPLAQGYPIIGSMLHAMGDPRDFLLDEYQRLGPIFRLKALHINYVVMAGPQANQFVNTQGRDCFQSKTFWSGMMHELEADNFLIGLDGDEHTQLRKYFKADFSKAALDPYYQQLSQLVLARFDEFKPGQSIAVVDPVLQLTSQMIGCVMTGKIPNPKELESFLYYVNEITNHFSLQRLPAWLLKLRGERFKQAKEKTLNFAEAVIDEFVTGSNSGHNFVDTVMQAAEKCPHLFASGDIRFSAILPLFAGVDTLGQSINYALFELHRHPKILAQLRQEVDQMFAQGPLDAKQIKAMPVMNSVIMETLRLHPSAFGMVRTAACDFQFGGHQVKKGQDVVILTTACHHLDEYFKEPQSFDIERFMAPRYEHRKANIYAPFGRGPHSCLGAGMAENLLALTLANILHHYEFAHLDPNIKYKERIGPTPSLGKQFQLQLLKRRQLNQAA